ncbi:MAG: hypothetical protein ABI556_02905 [Gemmatimonadales bacterium]
MKSTRLRVSSIVAAAVAVFVPADDAPAQEGTRRDSTKTATAVPAPEYRASGIKRLFLGSGWRDLWTMPMQAPMLNLDTYAGGLKFQERGGGKQSLSIHFTEQTGWREHQFRSVNKFPLIQAMPPEVRGTLSGDILQDEVNHLLPAAPALVPPLMKAIGALYVEPEFYVMPNDPRLGVYRDTFALMLGTMELSPQEGPDGKPGFAGSTEIQNMDKFLETVIEGRVHRFDEKEMFGIRLVDFLINDNDRGYDNSRAARFGDSTTFYNWRPIPRDRDRAFTNADGLLVKFVIRPVYPKLIAFGEKYDLNGLLFTGHELDRALLQRITRSDAVAIAQKIKAAITDDVIENVIAQLPRVWREQNDEDERLRDILKIRRDNIPGVAIEFYNWLATEVDLSATNQNDRAVIDRNADGSVTVTMTGRDERDGAAPFRQRTFFPGETNEVRVFLYGGKDVAIVRGASNDQIIVRIIGGKGDDTLTDSTSGTGVRFYDEDGDNKFVTAGKTKVSENPWALPKEGAGTRFDSEWRPDWGRNFGFGLAFDFVHGGGLVVGGGPRYKQNGFRRLPHKIEAHANALIGTSNGLPGIDAKYDYRAENSPVALVFNGRATKFEAFSFRGFGNESAKLTTARARVDQDLVSIEPVYVYQIGWRKRVGVGAALLIGDTTSVKLRDLVGTIQAGPAVYWTDVKAPANSPYANQIPEGRDIKGRVGGRIALDLDQTSGGGIPDRGFTLESELTAYPAVWDVNKAFGTASATGAAYIPLPGVGTHVAMKAGGAIASYGVPILHAPAIGGRETLRGYSWRRFTGEKTAFGSAELRVPVGTLPLFIRWKTGVFGLADVGRVWFDGESTGDWHSSFGGGVFLTTLGQTVSISYAQGKEGGGLYFQKGMSF